MKPKHLLLLGAALCCLFTAVNPVSAQGTTSFTYSGQLFDNGAPANGLYDMEFTLHSSETGNSPVGNPSTVPVHNVNVVNGLFTAVLDFGPDAFTGDPRWLQVSVGPTNVTLTILGPRPQVRSVPQTSYARRAGTSVTSDTATNAVLSKRAEVADTAVMATNAVLSKRAEVADTAEMATNAVVAKRAQSLDAGTYSNTVSFSSSANSFSGIGTGLTSLDASQLMSGAVPDARLSANVATLNSSPVFTGTLQAGGDLVAARLRVGSGHNLTGTSASIAGGQNNTNSAFWGTISGGQNNTASAGYATVGGGNDNNASGASATVGGGGGNTASDYATVSGGGGNKATKAGATVGGGQYNTASGFSATIGGGTDNLATNSSATVGGGFQNIAGGSRATVGGGSFNEAIGDYATVPGGQENSATTYAFAAGLRAKAIHDGCFVWADSSFAGLGVSFSSTAANQFLIRASGGVGIGTTTPVGQLDVYSAGQCYVRLHSANAVNGSVLELRNDSVSSPAYIGAINFQTPSTTPGQIGYGDGNGMTFRSGGSERMRITPIGLVGIGRTAIANRLEVEGNASKTTVGSWLANSDARIKQDIQPVGQALETLDKVRPVSFRYTDDYRAAHSSVENRRYLNVVAQEFREVFPEHVKSSGEKLPNGGEILQVDTYPLTIYSVAAIQELSRRLQQELRRRDAENAELKQKNVELETRLSVLEKLINHLSVAQGGAR